MPYVTVDAEVWIEPSDILVDLDDDSLVAELKSRGYNADMLTKVAPSQTFIGPENRAEVNFERLYELKKLNSLEFDRAFADYCWATLGKIV